jgi:predicted anti-sigma-YlaC factor YlaD
MSRHVTQDLIAYLDGALTLEEMSRVKAHLDECESCRTELERSFLHADGHNLQNTYVAHQAE